GMDGLSDEAVGLAVDLVGRLGVGRVDQAIDLPGRFVDPVAEIADAVAILRLEIGEMSLGDVARLDSAADRGPVHEQRHRLAPFRRLALAGGGGAAIGGATYRGSRPIPTLRGPSHVEARTPVVARAVFDGPGRRRRPTRLSSCDQVGRQERYIRLKIARSGA